MIAVDAGTHLSSIVRILAQQMPLFSKDIPPSGYSHVIADGPFAGVKCHSYTARANALYIFRELMHAFLITHPHLDHLSAMGINTPALEYGREAKTIVALDSTIEAIKSHIFNDSIWPNLSDEGSGVGFVTYRRLKEGGNNRLGSGDARGYVRVCDSLATLCMGVTHGKCKSKPAAPPHHRSESTGWPDPYTFPQRRLSRISDHESYFAAVHPQRQHPSFSTSQFSFPPGPTTPGYSTLHTPNLSAIDNDHSFEPVQSSAFFILNEETNAEILVFGDIEPDAVSSSPQNYKVWKVAAPKVANGTLKAIFIECSYDDSVRDSDLYGHLCPRHLIQELLFLAREVSDYKAQKAAGVDTPTQANEVKRAAEQAGPPDSLRKRKKLNGSGSSTSDMDQLARLPDGSVSASMPSGYVGTRSSSNKRKSSFSTSSMPGDVSPISLRATSPSRIPQLSKHVHFSGAKTASSTGSPRLSGSTASPLAATQQQHYPPTHLGMHASMSAPSLDTSASTVQPERPPDPMQGLVVHIIHVKDTLMDGPSPGEIILAQLQESAEEAGLECEFDVTDAGQSIWV